MVGVNSQYVLYNQEAKCYIISKYIHRGHVYRLRTITYCIASAQQVTTHTVLVKTVSPCCMQLLVACGRWSDCSIPHTHGHHSGGTVRISANILSLRSVCTGQMCCVPSLNMLYCSVLLCIKCSVQAFQPFSGGQQCFAFSLPRAGYNNY